MKSYLQTKLLEELVQTAKTLDGLYLELWRRQEAKKCKSDLIYLVSQVLGSTDPKKNLWGKIHYKMAEHLQKLAPGDRALFLIPRGHLKSTLVTQGFVIQRLLLCPSIRVMVGSAKKEHAIGFSTAIKRNLEQNRRLVDRFGYLSVVGKGKAEAWDVLGHTHGDKEHSITAASIGTDMTSQHYDLIVLDDPINRDFAQTETQRQKVVEFYMDCQDLLMPDGIMIVIGCLVGDTLITKANGCPTPIKDMKIGDKVITYKTVETVEAVIPQGIADVWELKTKNHTIQATKNHPFLTETGFKRLEDLRCGDWIVSNEQLNKFTWTRVKSIKYAGKKEVFDLTVSNTHNFIAEGLVTHNTRWHFADIYSKLIEQNKKTKAFKVIIDEPMMTNHKYTRRDFEKMLDDPETEFLFPEMFDRKVAKRKFIDKISQPNGYYEFACQQMNFPVSDKNQPFRFEDIKFVWEEDVPKSITTYQNTDPAGSETLSATQDDTAIATTGIDVNLDIYCLDMWSDRTTSAGVFVKMDIEARKYPQVRKIGIEKNFNSNNAMWIKDKYPNLAVKLIAYKMGNTADAKESHILILQPYVSNGKFYMVQHRDGIEYVVGDKILMLHEGQYKLLMQMIDYGQHKGGHDDALDALAWVFEFIRKPKTVTKSWYNWSPADPKTGY